MEPVETASDVVRPASIDELADALVVGGSFTSARHDSLACSVSVMGDDHDALIAEARRLGGSPTLQDRIADWRAFLGARYTRFEQAKRLADPAGILGRFR